MKEIIVTTSWDDGHPLDLRLGELLLAMGFQGTFYVPKNNVERPHQVLGPKDLRQLANNFEIGAHTLDHVRLTSLSAADRRIQLVGGKLYLEDVTGRAVSGFCYPGGQVNLDVVEDVKDCGFVYARTVDNLYCQAGPSQFLVPTTLQIFPHTRLTYTVNFLRGRLSATRLALYLTVLSTRELVRRVGRIARVAAALGTTIHIWGHSWEIDQNNLWNPLGECLRIIRSEVPIGRYCSNLELVQMGTDQN